MLDVIIADDERIIREGLAESVDWKAIGCRLVGTAETGIEALDLLREKQPHCAVTDIRMPLMNGLELIRTARENGLMCRFVILSGYDEFEFARQAMQYGVRYYLLKPFDEEELSEVLVNIREEFEINEPSAAAPTVRSGNCDIDKILSFLTVHYRRRDLSLKWVAANLVYKNKDYLGKLFKKCTGTTFHCYLTRLRIEQAAKLLRKQPDTPVVTLAERVGYLANGEYFCTQFKSIMGMTVTAFRSSLATAANQV